MNPSKVATILTRWELPLRGVALRRPRNLWIPLGVAVVLFGGLSALAVHSFSSNSEYREVLPKRGDLTSSILTSGRVQPDNRVDIKAPIPGRVEKILVKEGDHVKKGEILLWMSSSERAATLDAARLIGPEEVAHWEKHNPATPVVAPVDGLVIQRNIEPGQAFSTADAILVLSDRFVVEAPIDETDVARIEENQSATTTLDAFPDHPLDSKVLRVAHESKTVNNVTTYMMEIELKEVPDFVRVGMTANVSFQIAAKKDVLLVPSEALKATENELYVLVGNPGSGKPEKRVIQIGLSDGITTEVVSGLREDEVVYIPVTEPLGKTPKAKPRSILSL
ncbi:MAG TPA: HlyD family efflux transporter periplasmic adaptor subunit [Pseudobdellovibrionaceae bacterium]|nr:HlyD family efflux transporter periplasmic adaptor subunit [Pseudobdellovibrionaceae bacterium]